MIATQVYAPTNLLAGLTSTRANLQNKTENEVRHQTQQNKQPTNALHTSTTTTATTATAATTPTSTPTPTPTPTTVRSDFASCADWLDPTADQHKGLVVQRSINELMYNGSRFCEMVDQLQYHINKNTMAGDRREDDVGQLYIDVEGMSKQKSDLNKAEKLFKDTAENLVSKLTAFDYAGATELAEMIKADAVAMAMAVFQIHDGLHGLVMRLELMGHNTCGRWHQDNYVGRAIVTYNGPGTQFQEDINVDYGLLGLSNQEGCIRDLAQTRQVKVGDVLFMRGSQSKAGGLVHRSPPKVFWADGRVLHRLVLKVDIPACGC